MSNSQTTECYVRFENEICDIGSQLDGKNLFDLIEWHQYDDGGDFQGEILLKVIPRIGETVHLNDFWFEVIDIRHRIYAPNSRNKMHLLLRQLKRVDPRTKW